MLGMDCLEVSPAENSAAMPICRCDTAYQIKHSADGGRAAKNAIAKEKAGAAAFRIGMRSALPQRARLRLAFDNGKMSIGQNKPCRREDILLWRMLALRGGRKSTSFTDRENLFSRFAKPLTDRPYCRFLLMEPSDPLLKLNTGIGRCRQ